MWLISVPHAPGPSRPAWGAWIETCSPPATRTQRSGRAPDPEGNARDLYRYVYLATPDEDYYVGLDMASALHPQTLLCDTMNWQPLTREHGAPLRLYLAVKYGFKSLKRIGLIRFQDERPPDYWAGRGYDWFAGL